MPLYDFVAPFYDPFLRPFYRRFRKRALDLMPELPKATVLDLACGTGQNFPLLAPKIGTHGRVIGVDISSGMLRGAKKSAAKARLEDTCLIKLDAKNLSAQVLKDHQQPTSVDFVICTYGFTAMHEHDWKSAFHRAYSLLKPGGGFLIHDIHAEKHTWHADLVERITHSDFSRKTWEPLEKMSVDFHMEYLDPSKHIFGGRLFVAYGIKH